jgi:hypothetical protein
MEHIVAQNAEIATYEHRNICAGGTWCPQRGDLVRARTADGSVVVRRVWDVGERVIYLCSERQFAQLKLGSRTAPAIGFPKRDVFFMPMEEPMRREA